MWLQDLEKALARLKEECDYNFICVEKITPSADGGIVFKTTYHTYIKWFPNGEIEERKEEEWRTPPQITPTGQAHATLGGQMVRKMIEAYEGRMNNG